MSQPKIPDEQWAQVIEKDGGREFQSLIALACF
jgi:hypothetical protein